MASSHNSSFAIAIFCSAVAVTMTALYLLLRVGFLTNVLAVLGTLAISLLLINVPVLVGRGRAVRVGLDPTPTDGYRVWIVGGVIFAGLVAWLMWAGPNAYPLATEAVMLGRYGPDSLYHASMISMIRTYGVPTTGIDGIPRVPYHFGSYLIYIAITGLTGAQPIEFYEYSVPILALPFFLSRLLAFALDGRQLMGVSNGSPAAVIGVLIAAFAGVIPLDLSLLIGETRWVMMRSDSHLWGMALMFTLFSLILRDVSRRREVRDLSAPLLLAIPLLVGVIGLIKLSVMYGLVALIIYAMLRFRLWRSRSSVLVFVATMLIVAVVYRVVAIQSFFTIRPLAYLRIWVPLAWWPVWVLLAMLWPLLVAFVRLRRPSRPMIDLEVLAVLVIVGIAPAMLLEMPIQDAIWFLEISKWVAVGLMIAYVPLIVTRLRALRLPESAAAGLIGVTLVWIMLANVIGEAEETLRRNLGVRVDYSQYADHTEDEGIRALVGRIQNGDGVAEFVLNHWRYANAKRHAGMMAELYVLSTLPRSDKRESLLFIPQTNDQYWEMGNRTFSRVCQTGPFIAPAITGIAMLDGLPDPGCDSAYWGYEVFGRREGAQTLSADNIDALCARADELGFHKVIVMDSLVAERIDCE